MIKVTDQVEETTSNLPDGYKPDVSQSNTENSELCMQEMVSPFRNINLTKFELESSPEASPVKH